MVLSIFCVKLCARFQIHLGISFVYTRAARFFLVHDTKTGKKDQMSTKCTEWSQNIPNPWNIPNGPKIYQQFPIWGPENFSQNWDFWFENKPSGNPGLHVVVVVFKTCHPTSLSGFDLTTHGSNHLGGRRGRYHQCQRQTLSIKICISSYSNASLNVFRNVCTHFPILLFSAMPCTLSFFLLKWCLYLNSKRLHNNSDGSFMASKMHSFKSLGLKLAVNSKIRQKLCLQDQIRPKDWELKKHCHLYLWLKI
jgi:hypothetical protein